MSEKYRRWHDAIIASAQLRASVQYERLFVVTSEIASKFDQLIACAIWNEGEADIALERSGQGTVADREYQLRRHKRLLRQANHLYVQADLAKRVA